MQCTFGTIVRSNFVWTPHLAFPYKTLGRKFAAKSLIIQISRRTLHGASSDGFFEWLY